MGGTEKTMVGATSVAAALFAGILSGAHILRIGRIPTWAPWVRFLVPALLVAITLGGAGVISPSFYYQTARAIALISIVAVPWKS